MESSQMETTDSQEWTVEALAQKAGISAAYIRRMCRNGIIRARKFGYAWLIPYEEGQRWLDGRAAQSKSEDEVLTTEA